MNTDVPEGFAPLKTAMGFTELTGPLYGKIAGDDILLGFRVELRHCNPGRVCHGGMLMNFADTFLAVGARYGAKMTAGMTPTVSLACDFVAPAPLGVWVEGKGELVKATKSLLFTQGLASVD